jgi:hypothetical protein
MPKSDLIFHRPVLKREGPGAPSVNNHFPENVATGPMMLQDKSSDDFRPLLKG